MAAGAGFLSGCQAAEPPTAQSHQVSWGESVYAWHCARCHAPDRSVQTLDAVRLMPTHANAEDLFEFTKAAMPLDEPATLPDEDYWAVIAYLLERENLLELPGDETLGEHNAQSVPLGDRPLNIEPEQLDSPTGGRDASAP